MAPPFNLAAGPYGPSKSPRISRRRASRSRSKPTNPSSMSRPSTRTASLTQAPQQTCPLSDAPDCLLHPFLNPPPFTLPALPFSPLESVTDAAAGRRSVRGTAVCIEQASQCVGPPSPPPLPRLSTKADSVDMACNFAGAPSALTSDRPLVPARAGNLSPDILPARPGHSSLPPPRALIARIS
jgi:hypothetical protein